MTTKNSSERLRELLRKAVYADMYDFVYRIDEYQAFWKHERSEIFLALNKGYLRRKGEYLFLPGREQLIEKTQIAKVISNEKIKKTKAGLMPLIKLPWVRMVGITGTVGANNAKLYDDIDIFVITDPNRVWITRAFEIFYFGWFKKQRILLGKDRKDKFCFNVYMNTAELEVPDSKKTEFGAYQALLVNVIYGEDVYAKFLSENDWIEEVLRPISEFSEPAAVYTSYDSLLDILDLILGTVQKWRLKKVFSKKKGKYKFGDNLFLHFGDLAKGTEIKFEIVFEKFLKRIGI